MRPAIAAESDRRYEMTMSGMSPSEGSPQRQCGAVTLPTEFSDGYDQFPAVCCGRGRASAVLASGRPGGRALRVTVALLGLALTLLGSEGRQALAEHLSTAAEPAEAGNGWRAPRIISRPEWDAKPPLLGMVSQQPRGIVLHHTGVRRNDRVVLHSKMRRLQSFSQRAVEEPGQRSRAPWPDVPYHYYVDSAGRIAEGRDVRFAGDTNTGYDTNGYIQIAVEGDFEQETPTSEQLDAVRDLTLWLSLSWGLVAEAISTHRAHAATACPGRNFLSALPGILAEIERRRAAADALCRQPSAASCGTKPQVAH
jgi:hypothetical protein